MIRVFSFHPEHFNNNGDQGNIEALAHFTKSKTVHSDLQTADFVLFGDGSRAAMRHYESELKSCVPALSKRLSEGAATLLVGSCYEYLFPKLGLGKDFVYGQRISEAREVSFEELDVKGYRNSELQGSDLFVSGAFVGTTLYGPVLAKNPGLLRKLAESLGLSVEISADQMTWIEKI